ncbi:MAG: elongation factor P-like protein YeiP [Wenzhouxiangellaceae bacterium]|nr:elongation factor P-like protein YeiP [Wenzhouxiangellaceae bacterium]
MPRASEIKRGFVMEHDGRAWAVRDIGRSTPTARGGGTLFRFKVEAIPGGDRQELTFKGDDLLRAADLVRRQSTYSYRDGERWVFMDDEDFSQYLLDNAAVGDAGGYISDGLAGIFVLLIDGSPVAIALPQSVELEVAETAPVMKGATASRSAKPATTASGLEVMVPDYITPGERIRVNTETGEFMGRA